MLWQRNVCMQNTRRSSQTQESVAFVIWAHAFLIIKKTFYGNHYFNCNLFASIIDIDWYFTWVYSQWPCSHLFRFWGNIFHLCLADLINMFQRILFIYWKSLACSIRLLFENHYLNRIFGKKLSTLTTLWLSLAQDKCFESNTKKL